MYGHAAEGNKNDLGIDIRKRSIETYPWVESRSGSRGRTSGGRRVARGIGQLRKGEPER